MFSPKIDIEILYQDAHYIFIYKPAGVASVPERNNPAAISVQEWLKQQYPQATLCHRLDKETSGVLVAAQHIDAHRELSYLFHERLVNKYYHALVKGVHHIDEPIIIDLPLNVSNPNKTRVDKQNGIEAITAVISIAHFKHYTLLECKPVTGRTHQIRVHLAYYGTPIVGDYLYGGEDIFLSQIKRKNFKISPDEQEKPLNKRFQLHAQRIRFENSFGSYNVSAPYPKDFEIILKQLRKYDL
ncbi:MAG: RluA family pseudouridine synthase [Bacteroidia bacterium]|nr:RluA family pseudouridine synthase [Bacteroidia bacterium]MDW8303121.1 RluA family pseudouridine synthase [Bacteroidia bacterium]